MSTPILTTKLYLPPPRPDHVPRPRLLEQLNSGLHRKLALISAPAGFGKSTLVSAWLANLRPGADAPTQQEHRPAWLALDESDSTPGQFLSYFIAAIQTVVPEMGSAALAMVQSPQPPPIDAILTTLLNELATITEPLVLVLDDYHLVDAPAVDRALAFLLEHLPPQMHLVITTREDPNLPLPRLRVRGQLTEIRAADLRFTAAEATRFLEQMIGVPLGAEEVAALEARTEGWIAGLQLAALSLQGQAMANERERATFIRSFTGSHRFVMDYLVEEVLERQPPQIQTFLLRTAILDRLCGPLCDAVMEVGVGDQEDALSGQAILAQLEQANLFLIPLDNERRWYRYHHLFADLLRQRLQQQIPSSAAETPATAANEEGIAAIHRRAAIWFEENELPLQAIHHGLAAADFVRVANLAEMMWPAIHSTSFESPMFLDWIQALPAAMVEQRPVLSVGAAWEFLDTGDLEAADHYLRKAEWWLTPDSEEREMGETGDMGDMIVVDEEQFQLLPATVAIARMYLAQSQEDLVATVEHGERALSVLPADDDLRRGQVSALLGLAYWTDGALERAYQYLANGMHCFERLGNIQFALSGTYGLADICITQGRLRAAKQLYAHALELALAHHDEAEPTSNSQRAELPKGTAEQYLGLGEIAWLQGEFEAAQTYLQQGEAISEDSALLTWVYRFPTIQAYVKQSQGELDAALHLLDQAERNYKRGPVPDVRPLAAQKVRLWIKQGRVAEAATWVEAAEMPMADEKRYIYEYTQITFARLLITQYRLAQEQNEATEALMTDALDLLARLLQSAESGGRMGSAIELLMLQALAHEVQGDSATAIATLERALQWAEPEGYVSLFVDEGPVMARLLSRAAAQTAVPAYVATLLSRFGDGAREGGRERQRSTKEAAAEAVAPPAQTLIEPLIEPLSERELEVLQLVAEGLSNREIADRLFIALSTVKGHNRIIYGKLQVQRRTEAVAKAQALGLV